MAGRNPVSRDLSNISKASTDHDAALSTRGPPTEDDPDAEEKARMGGIESDINDDEKLGEKLVIKTNLASAVEGKAAKESAMASAPTPELFED